MGLIKVADMYRAGVEDLQGHSLGRFVLRLAPAGTPEMARNIDYFVIVVGVAGIISSVALQAVPAQEWQPGGSWHDAAGIVFWLHAAAVFMLALSVGAGLFVVTRGARGGENVEDGGSATN